MATSRRFGRFFVKDGKLISVEEALPVPSEENYEKVFKSELPKVELKNPEDMKATSPANTTYSSDSDSSKGVSEDLAEETLHSAWIQKILEYRRVEENYMDREGMLFASPMVYLQVVPLVRGAWNIVKGGYKNDLKKRGEMEKMLRKLTYNQAELGLLINRQGQDLFLGPSLANRYYPMVDEVITAWDTVSAASERLGFGLAYRKKDKEMELLEKYRKNPSKGISKKGAEKGVEKEEKEDEGDEKEAL